MLIDMDGVLYRGKQALPGLVEFFEWTEGEGHEYALVTNNATRTPGEIAKQLRRLGLAVEPQRIVTSSLATADWLRTQAPAGARVEVLGGPGLFAAVFGPGSPFTPDWVGPEWLVVGLDMDVTYQKLSAACLAVQAGAQFVATNPDPSLPTEAGLTPGAGSLQAVITLVTGVRPTVIGKPETALFEMALRGMGGDGEVLVIGDRLDTDILAGIRLGAQTALVLTGVSTREEAEAGEIKPDYIFEDLPDLIARWNDR